MTETALHHDLVAWLLSYVAGEYGMVTHVAGRTEYPDPEPVGRHEPDLVAETPDGTVVIGEAKIGDDLDDEHSLEQLRDFSKAVDPDGNRIVFLLCVPAEWVEAAEQAIVDAGGELHESLKVLGA